MKEKIKKIHDKYVAPCEYGITSSDLDLVSQEIEHLVNQEVERRIAERMPSDVKREEIIKSIVSNRIFIGPEQYRAFRVAFREGWNALRSRLTQKTEGGE